ncbi:MAG: RDD family protein [Methanobrevibacter sp.]|jgi:uncharacterized RDD family membrane protein YckC|nr:RDD family protein [Candidatus Methanoflexus mossambicus]
MKNLMKKRIIAYIADFFVVSAILWIITWLLGLYIVPNSMFVLYDYFIVISVLFCLFYFIILEKIYGQTIGKELVFLKVKDFNNKKITYKQSLIRNISKIFWIIIIFDYIIGIIIKKENDRILGVISKTKVVENDNKKINDE